MPPIVTVTVPFPDAGFNSFTIVRDMVVKCLADRYRVTDDAGHGALHIHIGSPDDAPRSLLDHRLAPLVLFAFVETPTIPRRWVEILDRADAVAVPSHFCRDVLECAGVTAPLHLVPLGLDLDTAAPLGPDVRDRTFTVMWQGGYQRGRHPDGSVTDGDRKCGHLVEQAFRKAALPDSRLVLKSIPLAHPGSDRRTEDVWRIERVLPRAEIAALDRQADLFVWPTRGEGFGLPPLEKLANGVPVMVPGWSGPLDYLYTFPDAQIDDFRLVDVEYNHVMTKMADVDIDIVVERLRWAHANLDTLRSRRAELADTARTGWNFRRSMAGPLLRCVSAVIDAGPAAAGVGP